MKLCLTLAESSAAALEEQLDRFSGRVPLIELRLDHLQEKRLPRIPGDGETRVIATCRPIREGGVFAGGEAERLELLNQAAKAGCQWVDLESDAPGSIEFGAQTRIIRSKHLFDDFPESLDRVWNDLLDAPGDAYKLAVRVDTTRQLVALLSWMENLPPSPPFVVIGMGAFGQLSRFLGPFLGSLWTYASIDGEFAPGQLSLEQACNVFRLQERPQRTALYGVIGNPVAHSLSPLLHNRLFETYRHEGLYLPTLLDELDPWFEFLESTRLEFRGFSVTIPYKSRVSAFLTRTDASAASVNTLQRTEAGWEGTNTDRAGLLIPLRKRLKLQGRSVVLLGYGGAARSVAASLVEEGCRVTVVGRDARKSAAFAEQFKVASAPISDPPEADICVNATPVGQLPDVDATPLPAERLKFRLVYDLVYNPQETRLLREARRQGIDCISGMEMFVEQAALQFKCWTGIDPDRDVMWNVLRDRGGVLQ